MFNNEDFLRLVAAVLASDGHVSGRERRFLFSLASQWQVAPETVDALIVQALAGKQVFKLPVTLKGQKDLIAALADAVAVDGEIAPQERELMTAIATRMRMSEMIIEALLKNALERFAQSERGDTVSASGIP